MQTRVIPTAALAPYGAAAQRAPRMAMITTIITTTRMRGASG